MNTTPEKIRAIKARIKIAMKQYNQAERLLQRLVKTRDQLERKYELAQLKQAAKHAK